MLDALCCFLAIIEYFYSFLEADVLHLHADCFAVYELVICKDYLTCLSRSSGEAVLLQLFHERAQAFVVVKDTSQ